MARFAAISLTLTLVYALALASFHPLDLLAGFVISIVLLLLTGPRTIFGEEAESETRARKGVGPTRMARVVAFTPFLLAVGRESLFGAWRVVLAVLDIKRPDEPGLVSIPLEDRTARGVVVSAFLAAFIPGTLLILVDEEERVMWIHALDARSPEAVRQAQQDFYRRYQSRVFP